MKGSSNVHFWSSILVALGVFTPISRFLPNFLSISLVFALLFYAFSNRKIHIDKTGRRIFILIIYVLIVSVVSIGDNFLLYFFQLLEACLLYLYIINVVDDLETLKRLCVFVSAFIFFNFFLGIYDGLSGSIVDSLRGGQSEFYNDGQLISSIRYIPKDFEPNYYQLILTFPLVYSTYILNSEKIKKKLSKVFWILILIATVVSFVLTVSKAAILVLVLFFGVNFLINSNKSKKILSFLLLLIIGYSLITFYADKLEFLDYNLIRYQQFFSKNTEELTTGRSVIWEFCLNVFENSPLFGMGLGNIDVELTKKYGIEMGTSHNSFLQILVDLGVFGVILYLSIFFTLININNWKQEAKYVRVFLSVILLSFLVMSSITAPFDLRVFFYLALASVVIRFNVCTVEL